MSICVHIYVCVSVRVCVLVCVCVCMYSVCVYFVCLCVYITSLLPCDSAYHRLPCSGKVWQGECLVNLLFYYMFVYVCICMY